MNILERKSGKMTQPIKAHPSRKYKRRHRLFLVGSGSLLVVLAVVCLSQFGLIPFLRTQVSSAVPMVTVGGVIEDGQTGQPLANVLVSARIYSFETQAITDGQGHFSMRVPRSSQIIVSTPNYDAQPITPDSDLIIKLAPTPTETARRYMQAFMQQNFAALWSMLHPDTQAFWSTEVAFASFLTHKFGPVQRLAFALGKVAMAPTWIDPDTTLTYKNVAVMPVSLTLGGTAGVLSPPSVQAVSNGLFANLVFAEVKSGGLWRVLVSGPLDQEAPIIVPAQVPKVTVKVPIMMYHHVSSEPTKNALDYSLTVKTSDFDAQMNYLAQKGYHPIKLTDVFDNLYYGMALPPHPIVITFDDGYADNFVYAFPILMSHHFVAEINVISGLIGGWYLTWDQIRQMNAAGIEIGSHTVHHVSLASAFPADAEHELSDSKTTLEHELGHPIQFFCYPSGEPFHHGTVQRQQFILNLLYQDGYVGALLDPGAESIVQDPQKPYELYRIRVGGGETLSLFIQRLNNLGAGVGAG
jgi:peptidoglycan/xylan/chitin deacetylase (PgdA/CDA1 family)